MRILPERERLFPVSALKSPLSSSVTFDWNSGSNVLLQKMYKSPATPAATAMMMNITISWSEPSFFAAIQFLAY